MNRHLLGAALASSLVTLPAVASAQRAATATAPSHAFVLNGGPMIGIIGTGFYGRLNPEFQLHQQPRFAGHAFNIGLAVVIWPNEGGPSFSVAPRWQYDQPLVPGTPFYVSPYAGLDVGLGVFDVFTEGAETRFRLLVTPIVGLDLKLVLPNRLYLGFRPIGIAVPIFFFGSRVTADVLFDITLSIGFTF